MIVFPLGFSLMIRFGRAACRVVIEKKKLPVWCQK